MPLLEAPALAGKNPAQIRELLKDQIVGIALNPPAPDADPRIARAVEVAVRNVLEDLRRLLELVGVGPKRDRGPVLVTPTGGAWFPFDPQPGEVNTEDIAIALSRRCRWSGATGSAPYSVAQHSVHVLERVAWRQGLLPWLAFTRSELERYGVVGARRHTRRLLAEADAGDAPAEFVRNVPTDAALELLRAALLHDAGEAYLPDVPNPIKRTRAMAALVHLERLALFAIGSALLVTDEAWEDPRIKVADAELAAIEWFRLVPRGFPYPDDLGPMPTAGPAVHLKRWSHGHAATEFGQALLALEILDEVIGDR